MIVNVLLLWMLFSKKNVTISDLEKKKPLKVDKNIDTKAHYCEFDQLFNALKIDSGDLVFLGDSFIDNFNIHEMVDSIPIKNRGIPGEFSAGVVHQLEGINTNMASKYFIYIGVNDILFNVKKDETIKNYRKIFQLLRQKAPLARIHVISILPFRKNSKLCNDCLPEIERLNDAIRQICASNSVNFIDISKDFKMKNSNQIQSKFVTSDGLHLNEVGYSVLKNKLDPYIIAQ